MLRRLIHILVVVAGVLALGKIWDLDLFGMAERSLGGQIASALLGIGLVLLLAYIVWEIARTAIDRRVADEANDPGGLRRRRGCARCCRCCASSSRSRSW